MAALTIIQNGGRCLAFKVSIDEFEDRFLFKGIEYGVRMGENCEYMVIKNFLSLPQSYFNLVYKEYLRIDLIDDTNFDLDGLNYIIKSKCELHELAIFYEDLEFVLTKY